jgi:phosphoesterase RecJ-like protein
MQQYPEAQAIADIIAAAQTIVIMQADNPDADSLGSALALEHILGDLGKTPVLYCGVEIPTYLRYLEGWDRVTQELPRSFDATVIVDASTQTLFEKLAGSGQQGWAAAKPCIVLDHHAEVSNPIPFATVTLNDHHRSSTGELIHSLAVQLEWPTSLAAQVNMMTAILGDTQGLSNQLTGPATYRAMADMTEAGVDRAVLEERRREANRMAPTIYSYKARLILRTEFLADGRMALVGIPQQEITEFSPLYNPGPLIQPDMLQTAGVRVSVVLKHYDDGKVTAAIRCNHGAPVAARLAEHFGGGGHAYASGFKIGPGAKARPFNEIKSECIAFTTALLDELEQKRQETSDDTLQHTDALA